MLGSILSTSLKIVRSVTLHPQPTSLPWVTLALLFSPSSCSLSWGPEVRRTFHCMSVLWSHTFQIQTVCHSVSSKQTALSLKENLANTFFFFSALYPRAWLMWGQSPNGQWVSLCPPLMFSWATFAFPLHSYVTTERVPTLLDMENQETGYFMKTCFF